MGGTSIKQKKSYVNIFDDMNEEWETIVDTHDTQRETDFLQNTLSDKGTILDLCCGTGRHSTVLSQRGWSTIGLDISKNLLRIAKQKMRKACVDFPLVRADMRYFPFQDNVFNAVVCMFTSFGYLPSESEDIKSLMEIRRTLQRGGRFLLDAANKDHIIRVFREKERAEFESFYMLEKRSLDLHASRLMSRWTIIMKDTEEVRVFQHNLRLYTAKTLKYMFDEAGLAIREVFGDYEKREFNSGSIRMIVLAERNPG